MSWLVNYSTEIFKADSLYRVKDVVISLTEPERHFLLKNWG